MNFQGQSILVTGASRGIGRAIAVLLTEKGARVYGTATSGDSIPKDLPAVEFVTVDFSKNSEVSAFVEWMKSLKRLDGLINNAGINRILPLGDVTGEDFDAVMDVDLRAPYLLAQAAAQIMKEQGGGHIVNIASIWSVITKPQRSLYCAAKTGLVGLTRALAVELAPDNVLVNAVSPGFVLTDLTRQSLKPAEIEQLSLQIPQRRMAEPEEIARVVAFLCSRENTYLTGQNITVDGGFTIV